MANVRSLPIRCASALDRSRSSATISSTPKGSACMVDVLSPLQPVWKPGTHGNTASGIGVVLTEIEPGSIVQLAAWPGQEKKIIAAIKKITGLALPDGAGGGVANDSKAAFGFAPGRFLIVDQNEGLAVIFSGAVTSETGT